MFPNFIGLLVVSMCMPLQGISNEKPVGNPRKNAPVFKKLYKGINYRYGKS